jgi:ribosomal protein L7/L12
MPDFVPEQLRRQLPEHLRESPIRCPVVLSQTLSGNPGETVLLFSNGQPVVLGRNDAQEPFAVVALAPGWPFQIQGDQLRVATAQGERTLTLSSWLDRELVRSFLDQSGHSASSASASSFGLHETSSPAKAPTPTSAPTPTPTPIPTPTTASAFPPSTTTVSSGHDRYAVQLAPFSGPESNRIMAIKTIREIGNVGLKEALDASQHGGVVARDLKEWDANQLCKKFLQHGFVATVQKV